MVLVEGRKEDMIFDKKKDIFNITKVKICDCRFDQGSVM